MHLPAKMAIWRKASDPDDPTLEKKESNGTKKESKIGD